MKLPGFLCLGGTEIVNERRTQAYLGRGIAAGWTGSGCACAALDENFGTPVTDPAPWYDSSHPESADFCGILPQLIDLQPVATRAVTQLLGPGGAVGRESLSARIVDVTGWMFAGSQGGMWWGERWLTEALRGRAKVDLGNDLQLLPWCRPAPGGWTIGDQTPFIDDYRTLVGAALVAGPTFAPVSEDVASYECQTVHFQLAAPMPWLYGREVALVSATSVAAGATNSAMVAAASWFDGEALVITLSAPDTAPANKPTDLTVTLTVSLDGTTIPETRIPASITYKIPELQENGQLIIDAVRREVLFADPTGKTLVPGFEKVTWGSGLFCWPEIPPCQNVVVSLHNGGAHAVTFDLTRRTRTL